MSVVCEPRPIRMTFAYLFGYGSLSEPATICVLNRLQPS